jgi:hypothetical protein
VRFSKAPLIATLMAVALSLLIILPALAENTDGQVYQGRTLSDELIVGVFADVAETQALEAPVGLSLTSSSDLSRSYMKGTPAADPRDTFFNGRLYVSNQAKAFDTVLVTHLVEDTTDLQCTSVEIRNENTGSKITLQLVPTLTANTVTEPDTRYYQNYFRVVDRDGTTQVENHNGPYVCAGDVEYTGSGRGSEVPVDDVDLTDVAPADDTGTTDINENTAFTAVIALDESLARINASDGDRLTIRAGTHIQEIYVDGEAPTFSEVTPGDGDRFKSAELRIGFEVRDGGSGLRHDGENVTSIDLDAVQHDAANADNTEPNVFGDNDGITDREPISDRDGGSSDIDVTFYTPAQAAAIKALEAARKTLTEKQAEAKTATGKADAAAAAATAAGTAAETAETAATTAETVARDSGDNTRGAAETALRDAATALGDASDDLNAAANTAPVATDVTAATDAATAATTAAGVTGTAAADATALRTAAGELRTAATELTAAMQVIPLRGEATTADGAVTNAMQAVTDADTTPAAGTEVDDHGSSGWTQVVRGVAYEANIVYYITTQGKDVLGYQWMVSAKDRVGNKGEANSKKRFDLIIDTVAPQVSVARTGVSYDVDKNKEVRNRNYIALTFTNGDGGDEDPIATSTLDVRDFIVEGFEVVDIIHPELLDDEKKADGEYKVKDAVGIDTSKESTFDDVGARDPRSRVYLELDSELGSAEKPRIQILGGAVTDLAGNQNSPPQQLTSIDKIPAGLTITVTSSDSSSGRVVATEDGTFTVTVDADEPLKRTPRVYFARFEVTAAHDENTGPNAVDAGDTLARLTLNDDVTVSPVADDPASALDVIERGLAWTQDYDADSSPFDGDSSVYVVLIWSEDLGGNAGSSSGWKSTADGVLNSGDTLDLVKLDDAGLLIEIDRSLEEADAVVLPSTDDDLVTESSNPYLQLIFGEAAENTAAITFEAEPDDDNADTTEDGKVVAEFKSVKDGTDTVALDAHKKVTLTAATVDDVDVTDSVGPGLSTTEDKFVIALRNLSAGEHTLTYSAVDEAGNELTDVEVEFEVKAHAAYKVAIRPGWNLISLPGTPVDNSIGDVMGADLDAAIVLGYQNGAWVSAIRNEGEWQGTLEEIVGGYGYWVQTTVFESISAVIPSADPTDVLPSVPVIAGWNLLGIVDISQGAAGSEPIGKQEADDYFVSIDWRVGYYFKNESNDWQKIVPDAEPSDSGKEILNGKGYWIWSIRPGKLVP